MIITCPHCGPRDLSEFSYRGDASRVRPAPGSTDRDAWNGYVYDRDNPAGDHREYWQHGGGCRKYLIVTRNTLTHVISGIRFADDGGAREAKP